jgi:endonuclease/exonuclease/phosphatase (EEP) superfamily protein YafD
MLRVIRSALALIATWLISGTAINLSKHPHWYVRGWDFPRTLTAALASVVAVAYAGVARPFRRRDGLLLAGLGFVVARQLQLIWPYTKLARPMVSETPPDRRRRRDNTLRLVMSNVLQENQHHGRWVQVVRAADPDVIVAVEIDHKWAPILRGLRDQYPHQLVRPQDNYYGMAVLSKLPFDGEPRVQFLVQDDIPSVHLTLLLRDGQKVRLHAVHPRPPEPIRDQDSAPRDAELVLIGRHIGEEERHQPTIVCGDLNDVAWSYTSRLFLRLSRLLDPRVGRGQYSSYNANSWLFRFPLDHVFHSDEFTLNELRVLPHVGSDHLPVYIDLTCDPQHARATHEEPTPRASDHEEAGEIIEQQVEREQKGKEQGHLSERVAAGRGRR